METLHLVTLLWIAPSMEFRSETYGTLGASLTILAWAYLLGQLVTSCAALNAALWRSSALARPAASSAAHEAAADRPAADSEPGAR